MTIAHMVVSDAPPNQHPVTYSLEAGISAWLFFRELLQDLGSGVWADLLYNFPQLDEALMSATQFSGASCPYER